MNKLLKHNLFRTCFSCVALIGLFVPILTSAQSTLPIKKLEAIQPQTGYQESADSDLAVIMGNVVNAFLSILGIIFIILMLYAGYKWMTAAGDESKVADAKETITRAIIGLVITVGSFAIWQLIFDQFLSK